MTRLKDHLTQRSALAFVVLIGCVSLLADMTYEGGRSIAGPFLGLLGASGAAVGFVAGFGEGVGYLLRMLFGFISDKTRQYWLIAFTGYIINLIAIPLLALAGNWPVAAGLLVLERVGKGIRNPARDVMLSHATQTMGRGWGFGLHEAMDQTGAMLGPLMMAGMLYFHRGYREGFAILAIPAVLALGALTTCWYIFRHPEDLETTPHPSSLSPLKGERAWVRGFPTTYWLYLVGVGLLAAGFTDFPLMAYHFRKLEHIPEALIPALYSFAMGVEAVGALVLGRLFDRIGSKIMVIVTVISASFPWLVFRGDMAMAFLGMGLWGIGMGAQGSVMKAVVAELVSKDHRGSAYGIYNAAYGLMWFTGSALMGWLYDRSISGLIIFSVAAQLLAIPLFLAIPVQRRITREV